MRPETASCVADAKLACERITEAVGDVDSQEYESDWRLQAIVERQFIIIGESILRIRMLEPEIYESLPDSHRTIGFRNLLVHRYDAIDASRVYDIVKNEMPPLAEMLDCLIADAHAQGL
jgi:uncharacterized protein with HEPN domain